jgi:predicted nucleic acid-binding protein
MDSSLRTLDALHLAVALSEGLTLVTADREFARAGRRHKANSLLIR